MEREPDRPAADEDEPDQEHDPLDDALADTFPASDPPSQEAPER